MLSSTIVEMVGYNCEVCTTTIFNSKLIYTWVVSKERGLFLESSWGWVLHPKRVPESNHEPLPKSLVHFRIHAPNIHRERRSLPLTLLHSPIKLNFRRRTRPSFPLLHSTILNRHKMETRRTLWPQHTPLLFLLLPFAFSQHSVHAPHLFFQASNASIRGIHHCLQSLRLPQRRVAMEEVPERHGTASLSSLVTLESELMTLNFRACYGDGVASVEMFYQHRSHHQSQRYSRVLNTLYQSITRQLRAIYATAYTTSLFLRYFLKLVFLHKYQICL